MFLKINCARMEGLVRTKETHMCAVVKMGLKAHIVRMKPTNVSQLHVRMGLPVRIRWADTPASAHQVSRVRTVSLTSTSVPTSPVPMVVPVMT